MVRVLRILVLQLTIAASALGISYPATAETTARLDRDAIDLGETVRLQIESDVPDQSVAPDLSILETNFNILGTSVSQNISVVNGTQEISRQWIVELEPGSAGSFTIPAIAVGTESTNLLRLTVTQPTGDPSSGNRDIFLEIDIGLDSAYVQQMIPLTVRLFLGVEILDGSLTDPTPPNTDVIRLGNDARYSKSLGSRPYRVIERKYAIFAQSSGELVIPPVQFQGLVADDAGSNQTFGGLFNQGRRVRAISDQTILQVAPPNPGNSGRNWLPATKVEIQELQTPGRNLVVGEPYTRQIVVSGTGVRAEQLPDLDFPDKPGLRQYPDKVSRENRFAQRDLTGVMGQSVALIPAEPGSVTVPEITIPWWDVVNDEPRVAVLPGWTIEVAPDESAGTSNTNGSADTIPIPGEITSNRSTTDPGTRFWMWSSIALGTLWILTILFLLGRRLTARRVPTSKLGDDKFTQAQILDKLYRACRQNNAMDAYSAIREWVRQQTGPGVSLSIQDWIAGAPQSGLKDAIQELEGHLFSAALSDGQKGPWNGSALEKCLPDLVILSAHTEDGPDGVITDLYPTAAER